MPKPMMRWNPTKCKFRIHYRAGSTNLLYRWDSDTQAARNYLILQDSFPLLIQSEAYLRANPDCAIKVLDFVSMHMYPCARHYSHLSHRLTRSLRAPAVTIFHVCANV